ncbi:alpha-N-arab-like proteininofuranosidase [Apiospora arundinis]|uniref:Infection structure specific protein n=1 Tax=Apiospora arundinis TaxID=335852 RepID=A0ABR2IGB0_9PEZI
MHFRQTTTLLLATILNHAAAQEDCKRDEPNPGLAARQDTATPTATTIVTGTADPTADCSSLQQSLNSAMPTLPALLASIVQTAVMPATTLSDICDVSVSSTATSAWTAYNLAYYDFFLARRDEFVSLATKCPGSTKAAALTSSLSSVLTAYSSFSATGCARKEVVTGTAGSANAAAGAFWPRETGAVNYVVAAAVGVAGAVVAL